MNKQNTSTTAKDGEIRDVTPHVHQEKYYKVVPQPYSHFLSVIGLFIPMPIIMEDPIFSIRGYGFGFSVAFGKYMSLGWIMIGVALIF